MVTVLVVGVAADLLAVNIKSKCPDPIAYFGLSEDDAMEYVEYDGAFSLRFDRSYPSDMDAQTALKAMTGFKELIDTEYDGYASVYDATNKDYFSYDYELSILFYDHSRILADSRHMSIY